MYKTSSRRSTYNLGESAIIDFEFSQGQNNDVQSNFVSTNLGYRFTEASSANQNPPSRLLHVLISACWHDEMDTGEPPSVSAALEICYDGFSPAILMDKMCAACMTRVVERCGV
jgi:hypothetical protein